MSFLRNVYWSISYVIHGRRVNASEGIKLRLSGSIQGGKNIFIGKNFFAGKDFRLYCQPEAKIVIGDDCGFMDRICITAGEQITIGNRILGGSDILITDNDHGTDAGDINCYANQPIVCSPTSIGDECWIGEHVCILKGTHIGERAVIGAGSVVTHDIPPYCIAVGNPAKVIKKWDFEQRQWVDC